MSADSHSAMPFGPVRRPLSPAERRLLRMRSTSLRAAARSGGGPIAIGAAGVGALWLATLAVSDAPWPVITAFWMVVGGGMVAWVARDARRWSDEARRMAADLDAVLAGGEAREWRVEAAAFVEFEEVEDEGAGYVFDLADGRLLFLSGQELYPSARFPSLDFSMVDLLDPRGRPVDQVVVKRGRRAAPRRVIPASRKLTLDIPEHMTVRRGTLATLETDLASGR